MALSSFNDFIARWAAGYRASFPIWGEQQAAASSNLLGTGGLIACKIATLDMLGALPTGVTSFIPTRIDMFGTTFGSILVGRLIKLGELDISGASGTFTDGAAMPSLTELGVSRQIPSAVIVAVKTALNATPGSITFTYTDQDGNTGIVSQSLALTASTSVGTCQVFPFTSASLDTGVIDITASSRTAGTTPTGVLEFFGMIPIARFTPQASSGTAMSFASLLLDHINLVRLGASEQLGFFSMIQPASVTGAWVGSIQFVGDN